MQNSVYINAFERNVVSYGKDYKDLELTSYLNGNGLSKINDFFKEYNFEQSIEYANQSSGNNLTVMISGGESEKIFSSKEKMSKHQYLLVKNLLEIKTY